MSTLLSQNPASANVTTTLIPYAQKEQKNAEHKGRKVKQRLISHNWYQKHKEEVKARAKKWRSEHPEKNVIYKQKKKELQNIQKLNTLFGETTTTHPDREEQDQYEYSRLPETVRRNIRPCGAFTKQEASYTPSYVDRISNQLHELRKKDTIISAITGKTGTGISRQGKYVITDSGIIPAHKKHLNPGALMSPSPVSYAARFNYPGSLAPGSYTIMHSTDISEPTERHIRRYDGPSL